MMDSLSSGMVLMQETSSRKIGVERGVEEEEVGRNTSGEEKSSHFFSGRAALRKCIYFIDGLMSKQWAKVNASCI